MHNSGLTLGEIINKLECMPVNYRVYFDWARACPVGLCSYRGYYSDLAIEYSGDYGKGWSVREALAELKGAVGGVFSGWKGGEFPMDRDTTVWVSCAGVSSGCYITDVRDTGYSVLLITEQEEI